VSASFDPAAVRRTFEEEGHVELRGLLAPERAAALVAHLEGLAPDEADENPLSRGPMAFYSRLWPRSEPLRRLLCEPALVAAVGAVLGGDLWVRWDQAVDKGPGAGIFPWHQDNEYSKLLSEHVQVWVALTSSDPEVGGLELVPRRLAARLPHHLEEGHVVYDGDVADGAVAIHAEPGDVVLFSSFTLHRTTPNVTDRHRWAYVAEYLSLDDTDPFLEPPYLVVARDGRPAPEVTDQRPGRWGPDEQARYAPLLDRPWEER
jgi:hypothetical protein